jgi:hypothetical protein
MCTVIRRDQKFVEAQDNIIVYKLCEKKLDMVISIYSRYHYIKGKENKSKFSYKNFECGWDEEETEYQSNLNKLNIDYYFIVEGFHSLYGLKGLKRILNCITYRVLVKMYNKSYYICEFTIPKGSFYYQSEIGNIVSDTIILNRILNEEDINEIVNQSKEVKTEEPCVQLFQREE